MKDQSLDIDLVILTKYLNGEADLTEIRVVDQWLCESPQNKEEFEKLQKAWEFATAGIGLREWDAIRSKEKFLWKVIQSQSATIKSNEKSTNINRKLFPSLLKYAALAVILIGISTLLVYEFSGGIQNKNFTEISVLRGSKTRMILADGTKLWLNASSKIKYSQNFNKQERDIFLEGEAYFEVAKNTQKPFNVFAGGVVVQAVGTIFNVKAYPDEKIVETTLVEGSVIVGADNKSSEKIVLKPNEQVLYNKPDIKNREIEKILVTKGIKAELFTSWISDKLVISSEDLESLTVKLGRKYDVVFHFDDNSLKKLRFTGILKNETIEQILEVLKISSPVNYRIREREIWLTRKNS